MLEEIAQIEDTPDDLINDLFHLAYWPTHALGRPVCGTRATVQTFDRDACRAWVARRYRPGSHRRGRGRRRAPRAHWSTRSPGGSRTSPAAAPLDDDVVPVLQSGVTVHRRRLEQVQLCLGTRRCRGDRRGARRRRSCSTRPSGTVRAPRLFQEVRERRGRAYYDRLLSVLVPRHRIPRDRRRHPTAVGEGSRRDRDRRAPTDPSSRVCPPPSSRARKASSRARSCSGSRRRTNAWSVWR